jgi:hypothetical protein
MTPTGRTTGTLTETCTLTTACGPQVAPGDMLNITDAVGSNSGGLWIVERVEGGTIHTRRPKWHERALHHARVAWHRVRWLRHRVRRFVAARARP